MPNWSHQIPTDPRGVALPIRRTPTAGAAIAICTADDLIGCDTHFYGGHTVPCTRPDCKACNDGIPYRWHAYLPALDVKTRLHFIFECTAQAADAFKTYREAYGSLRGCLFEAKRWHSRPNGRVIIRCKPSDVPHSSLPAPPDVPKCMAIVWQISDQDVTTGPKIKDAPSLAVRQRDSA